MDTKEDETKAGFELDKRIAKLLGWRWDNLVVYAPPNDSRWARCPNGKDKLRSILPYYSGSIGDAWQIVEHLKDHFGYNVHIHAHELENETLVKLAKTDDYDYYASSDNPALAICKAALQLLERQSEAL